MQFNRNNPLFRRLMVYDERGWYDDAQEIADKIGYLYTPGEFSYEALAEMDVNSPEYMFSAKTRESVEIKLALANAKLKERAKSGQLVVIYGLSQMGKDFYSNRIEVALQLQLLRELDIVLSNDELRYFMYLYEKQSPLIENTLPTTFAEVYKTRERRKDDKKSLHAVTTEREIPVTFDIRSKFGENQTVGYSTEQIIKQLSEGKIIIVTTTLPDIINKLKQVANDAQTTIKIDAPKRTPKQIAETEHKRYGYLKENVDEEIRKRIATYDMQYNEYLNFYDFDRVIYNSSHIKSYENSHECNGTEVKLLDVELVASEILNKYLNQSKTTHRKK